ncbi:MAG: hypothetical protein OHK0039_24880 [Bacteroidia bacterium]
MQQEVGQFDKDPAVGFVPYDTTPKHRLGKGFAHSLPFVGVVACSPVGIVGLHEQHLLPDSHKLHDALAPQLAAVQPNVVGADARRQAVYIQKLLVEAVDCQPDTSFGFIPIKIEEARIVLHLIDRKSRLRRQAAYETCRKKQKDDS